jgi:hypothetical protein
MTPSNLTFFKANTVNEIQMLRKSIGAFYKSNALSCSMNRFSVTQGTNEKEIISRKSIFLKTQLNSVCVHIKYNANPMTIWDLHYNFGCIFVLLKWMIFFYFQKQV